jgi:nitroreductase
MDLIKAIAGRRAVRDYTAETVSETTIRALIDSAVRAPNALNNQPWTFMVVRDQAMLDRISTEAKAHMLTTLSAEPDARHFRTLLEDPGFHVFYHAPVLVMVYRGLLIGGGKSDAVSLWLRTGLLLDWLRAALPEYAGRQGGAWPARVLGARGACRRWPPETAEPGPSARGADHPMGWLSTYAHGG